MDIGQYILVNGEPVKEPDSLKWAEWYETADRKANETFITDLDGQELIRVSTVFLGLDHDHAYVYMPGRERATIHHPILWETMVFNGPTADTMRRYRSKQDALKGHDEVVQELIAELKREVLTRTMLSPN